VYLLSHIKSLTVGKVDFLSHMKLPKSGKVDSLSHMKSPTAGRVDLLSHIISVTLGEVYLLSHEIVKSLQSGPLTCNHRQYSGLALLHVITDSWLVALSHESTVSW
jgi:hypothetical protein